MLAMPAAPAQVSACVRVQVKVEVSGSGVQAQLPEVPGMPTAVHPLRMAPMAMLHPFEVSFRLHIQHRVQTGSTVSVLHVQLTPACLPACAVQKRQGFDVVAWLKTPYGLMFAFMVVSLVVMPALKVDPEEYQQMVEERQRLSQHVTGGEGRQAGRREAGGGPRR